MHPMEFVSIVVPMRRDLKVYILVQIMSAILNSGCAYSAHPYLHVPRDCCASVAGIREDPYVYLVAPERESLLPITVTVALVSKSFFAKTVQPRPLLAQKYESAHSVGDLPLGLLSTTMRISFTVVIV